MEEFESKNGGAVKVKAEEKEGGGVMVGRNQELASSCYLNFMEEKIRKAENFKELAWVSYQSIKARKLRQRNE